MPKLMYNGEEIIGGSNSSSIVNAPIGAILNWSGTEDTIPAGWHICNGEDGTIDLRDKFVLGAGTTHSIGSTGGSENVTLTVAQMPSHFHRYSDFRQNTIHVAGVTNGIATYGSSDGSLLNDITDRTGSSQPHDNMPPYYTLFYIQKVSASPNDYVTIEEVNSAIDTKLEGISSEDVYSTTETRIGTWIDGKPLYRKVIEAVTSGVANNPANIFNLGNFEIVRISGHVISRLGDRFDINTYIKVGDTIQFISTYTSKAGFLYVLQSGDPFLNSPVVVIVEYTKPTDTQSVSTLSLTATAVSG